MAGRIRWLLLALTAAGAGSSPADPPDVLYIFPAGGQRGTKVEVCVGGINLHEECPFLMEGPGVAASEKIHRAPTTTWFEGPLIGQPASQRPEDYPKDQCGTVAIASDAALGPRAWRVWTSQGVTAARPFVIGDLPEVVEEEIDGSPVPVPVTLPVTVNGRIFPREDVDIWSFHADAGQSITCEVWAARLGSPLDSRLEVVGPSGRPIAESVDAKGTDSFVRFVARESGIHEVRIQDVEFGGLQPYVYRLTLTAGPHVEWFYPLGGRRGTTTRFWLVGQGLTDGPVEIPLPAESSPFHSHQFEVGGRRTNPVLFQLEDLPEHLESEPNDQAEGRTPLSVPGVGNGRIDRPSDRDVWGIDLKKGDQCVIEVDAARLGSRLDAVLTVEDPQGNRLAQSDDRAADDPDSRVDVKAAADGIHLVSVEDRSRIRGGPGFGYRLRLTPSTGPDFRLWLPADAMTVEQGGQTRLAIEAERLGGFTGEIALEFEGLPEGVTLKSASIPKNRPNATLTIEAGAAARIGLHPIEVWGRTVPEPPPPAKKKPAGTAQATPPPPAAEPLSPRRRAALRTNPGESPVDSLLLAIAVRTPFKIVGQFESRYAPRGSVYFRQYRIERNGFEGPIEIGLADRQGRHLQGVTGPTITVPAGVSEFQYPLSLPPWMEIGRTSRTVLSGVAVVRSPDGSQHKVCYSSNTQDDQIIVLVAPGRLSIEADRSSLLARPGTQVAVPVRVGRDPALRGPSRVELVVPEHMRGIVAEPLDIDATTSAGLLLVRFAESDLGPFNMPLTIRATVIDGEHPVIAQTAIAILPSPAPSTASAHGPPRLVNP